MAERNIDYDRGVRKSSHPTGVDVFMYYDTPGVYLNAYGGEVSDQFAHEAGFDTETYAKQKLRRELMAKAMKGVEDQLADESSDVHKVIANRGGVHVVDIGLGRFVIEDPDGQRLTTTHMSREAALDLLDKMVPEVKEPPKNPSANKGIPPKA